MRVWVSIIVLSLWGCAGGGGGASIPQQPKVTTQSIASGKLTAGGGGGATIVLECGGSVATDETETVSSDVPADVMALESGHVIADGFTLSLGPQAVTLVLDRCGAFSGGPIYSLSLNPNW